MPLLNSWVAVTRKEGRRIRGLPRPKHEVSGAQNGLSQTGKAPRCQMWMGKSRHERQSYRLPVGPILALLGITIDRENPSGG